jgi:hypothetical protein
MCEFLGSLTDPYGWHQQLYIQCQQVVQRVCNIFVSGNDLKECVEGVVPSLVDPQELAAHKKKEVKAKWILLDSVKDHLIPHIF